jgi:mono/diheme cytochrome c family protein
VPAGPGNTANVEALSRFFYESAQDPRFNSDNILTEIAPFTKLGWIDQLFYRFVVIPATKRRILNGGPHVLWSYGKDSARWGRGHDGPTYSSRYLPDGGRRDARYGSTQFPAIWNLTKYQTRNSRGEAQRLNLTGDGRDADAVITDSIVALLGAAPRDRVRIEKDAGLLKAYLERKPAPAYPYDRDDPLRPERVASGEAVFKRVCAACHAKDSPLVGRVMPFTEIQTDPESAVERGRAGAGDRALGYVVPHLDGIWLRGPYLHNGSVPTIRDLLRPAKERPSEFYRGYDVLDSKDLGFVSAPTDDMAKRRGMRFDTKRKGNGNQGHEYGTDRSQQEKDDLIEFLKTL